MANRSRSRIRKRMAFRRKLYILRTLVNSNSAKTSSIIMDAFIYISALKLKLEALRRENMKHIHQIPLLEVNVETLGENGYQMRVISDKGRDNLVYILQAFEEMGINVIDARVSCGSNFAMEAIIEVIKDQAMVDPSVLTEVVVKAIERSTSSDLSS